MRKTLLLIMLAGVMSLCGCGKNIVTVTGEVLYEGKPAQDIAILFEPKSDAKTVSESGVAVTDSGGRFTLRSSSNKRGIEPGTYTVYLGWKNPAAAVDDGGAGPPPGTTTKTPASPYRFPEDRSVIVEIRDSGKNSLVFRISPEGILCE